MKEFFLKHSRTWITLFAGLLMVIGVFACCGGFQYENPKEQLRIYVMLSALQVFFY